MSEQAAVAIFRILEDIVAKFGSLAYPDDAEGKKILATQLALRGARVGEPEPQVTPTPSQPEEALLVSLTFAPGDIPNTGTLFATDLDGRLWSRYVGDGSGWQEEDRPKVTA